MTTNWTKLHEDDGLEACYQRELAAARKKALALGLDRWLYPFQFEDVVRASLKQCLLLTYQMGLGKTRVAIALALLYGCQRNLLVVPKRLMGEWVTEFRAIGLAHELHVVETLEDCRNLKRFNLVALTDLWRLPEDSPLRRVGDGRYRRGANYRSHQRGDRIVEELGLRHSLASVLRKRFGFIAVDEAYSLKDVEANQTKAVTHLRAKHKVLLTGTPVRGYPNNILSLLNWAFGNGSALWPDYSFFVEGAVEKFLRRFGTYVYYDEEHRRTADRGKKKLLPKIRDPHGFQEMLAPKMIRRLNTEPEVTAAVRMPEPHLHYEAIEMDEQHRRAYEVVLADFQEWYEAATAEAEAEGRALGRQQILPKLTALIGCASFPQLLDPEWKDPTAKQRRVLQIVQDALADGRKVIVLSRNKEGAKWMYRRIDRLGCDPLYVDGGVSLELNRRTWTSPRIERIDAFRRSPFHRVLVATTPCLAEGLNIPEASVVVFLDYDWVPSVMAQAFSRVLRPQQERDVHVHFLTCRGTIEEYMELLCDCKRKAIAEGLDYEEYDFRLEDLPDIKAYAEALVTSPEVLERFTRRRFVSGYEREEGQGD